MSTTLDALDPLQDQVRFQLMNGEIVPVELSLFYHYPNSQLAQCALDVWNEDPEQIVYPLMDKDIFPWIISFLRAKKVCLPKDCGITPESFLRYLEKLGPWPKSLDMSQVTSMDMTIEPNAANSDENPADSEKKAIAQMDDLQYQKVDMKYNAREMFKFLSIEVTANDIARELLRKYLIDLRHTLIFSNKVQDYDTYLGLKRIKDGDVELGNACNLGLGRFGLKIKSLESSQCSPATAISASICETKEITDTVNTETEKSTILAFIKEDAPAVKLAGQSLRAFLKSDASSCFYFDESQAHRVYAPRILQKANKLLKKFGSIEIQSIERDGRIHVRLDEDY